MQVARPALLPLLTPRPPALSRRGDQRSTPRSQFHVEWTNGHGRSTHYFALLRAEDEPLLGALTEADLESYLDAAPAGATRYEGAHWRKRHVGWTDNQAKGGADNHDDFTAEGKVAVPNPNPNQMLPRTQALS